MSSSPKSAPIIRILNGTFYRHHPNAGGSQLNPPLFSSLSFELPSWSSTPHNWAVVGPSLAGKTTLLQALRGQHLCFPPTARSFPYLATDGVPHRLRSPHRAIQYVGFDAGSSGSGLGPAASAYLSARYESRREKTDFSLQDFLLGNTQLNPAESSQDDGIDAKLLRRVIKDLRLENLLELPVAFLSNGQGRRARIARALLQSPEVLLLDEPFMGLDPPTVASLSPLLQSLAERSTPRLVLSARPQDPLPDWISHLIYLRTDCQIAAMGDKETVIDGLRTYYRGVSTGKTREDEKLPVSALAEFGRVLSKGGIDGEGLAAEITSVQRPADTESNSRPETLGEPLVEMNGCRVRYGDRVALGNWTEEKDGRPVDGLVWTVRRGDRWGVFGANGSGKTTIVSLLCSDHPQTYSLPIKLFGRSRLPEPGSKELPLTFWDIQSRIGHSSPEIHQHIPRSLTIRQVVENAWADTFLSKPKLDDTARATVDATLAWFERELHPSSSAADAGSSNAKSADLSWADQYFFGELSFSAQRVLLLLRAVVKNPDIVVLDEAFSGMDEAVRDKCMTYLEQGTAEEGSSSTNSVRAGGLRDHQALICISHIKEEVPDCVREWLCLPETSTKQPARFGTLDGPLRSDGRHWKAIWGF